MRSRAEGHKPGQQRNKTKQEAAEETGTSKRSMQRFEASHKSEEIPAQKGVKRFQSNHRLRRKAMNGKIGPERCTDSGPSRPLLDQYEQIPSFYKCNALDTGL